MIAEITTRNSHSLLAVSVI